MIKETAGIKPPTALRIEIGMPSFRNADILAKEIALKTQAAKQMTRSSNFGKNIQETTIKCWSKTETSI
ncbi:MAG: hypothetical protein IKO93_21905, partial [Lentisphaeria bacterium]|nr:hypothetical protein [Lentisphaeria bacterium]